MPPVQRGQAYKLGTGQWGLRYYDAQGVRRRKSPFPSKSAALAHYRNVVEPQLRGEPAPEPARTLADLVDVYLERHAASVRPRTIATLRERLGHAVGAFGDVPLSELERMSGEIATWYARQPDRVRYARLSALRQTLAAAGRWGYMAVNPAVLAGRNPKPSPRPVRAFTRGEIESIAAEFAPAYAALPAFVAATGLRPEEWAALERRDIDRHARVLSVRRTVSGGEVVELGKTSGSRRQVPLARRALDALDAIPPRLDTPLIFPAPAGGLLNLDNWRRRVWAPAIDASGVPKPARPYDLRATFITNAISAAVPLFTIAKVAGTSVEMIERHYGALLDGAIADVADRLDALDVDSDRAADEQPGGGR
jgi:integrase